MDTEKFNALPLEARLYIESQQSCLSCGRKNDLDLHYKNYLKMKDSALFTLRGGAVSFFDSKANTSSILYPLEQKDTEEEKTAKLKLALRIHKVRPDRFTTISIEEIGKILNLVKKNK